MNKDWQRVKLPRVIYSCCGLNYDTQNINTIDYFKCFAHTPREKYILDKKGNKQKVKFCITIWLVCKNNDCVTSFTYYYNDLNKIITNKKIKGLEYIINLKKFFLGNIVLKINLPNVPENNKKYLWRYTDGHPTKKFVSNIFDLNDKKIGETDIQEVKTYHIN